MRKHYISSNVIAAIQNYLNINKIIIKLIEEPEFDEV